MDPRHDEELEPRDREIEEEREPSRPRTPRAPRRPGLVIGPTTGDSDVQLEW